MEKMPAGEWTPTENPKSTVVPGQMRSDREEIPEGFTKEDADKAETMEARIATARVAAGCQVYWPAPYEVCGAIRDKYNELGGPNSFLLWPTTNELTNPDGYGKRTVFQNGPIYWSPQGGAHAVVNHFFAAWQRNGWEAGVLGYPTSDEIPNPDGGRRQYFQGGTVYWNLNEAYFVTGAIRDKWGQVGWETGWLGYPQSDEIVLPDGIGRMNKFTGGYIYWHPLHGAHPVAGIVFEEWKSAGYEQGVYGYPISDEYLAAPGHVQDFQNGRIDYGLAATPISQQFYDCTLNLEWPKMTSTTNWVRSNAFASCNNPKQKIEVRTRTLWIPFGSQTETKKDDSTGVVDQPAGQVHEYNRNYYAVCFNGIYRFSAEFRITNADGGVMTDTQNTEKIQMSNCQTQTQTCPGISQQDCAAAVSAVLYARWFGNATRQGYSGNKVYEDRPGHLPAPIGNWWEYDIYPPGPDNKRLSERVVLDTGSPVWSPVWFSKDHYQTQQGWTEIVLQP